MNSFPELHFLEDAKLVNLRLIFRKRQWHSRESWETNSYSFDPQSLASQSTRIPESSVHRQLFSCLEARERPVKRTLSSSSDPEMNRDNSSYGTGTVRERLNDVSIVTHSYLVRQERFSSLFFHWNPFGLDFRAWCFPSRIWRGEILDEKMKNISPVH